MGWQISWILSELSFTWLSYVKIWLELLFTQEEQLKKLAKKLTAIW